MGVNNNSQSFYHSLQSQTSCKKLDRDKGANGRRGWRDGWELGARREDGGCSTKKMSKNVTRSLPLLRLFLVFETNLGHLPEIEQIPTNNGSRLRSPNEIITLAVGAIAIITVANLVDVAVFCMLKTKVVCHIRKS